MDMMEFALLDTCMVKAAHVTNSKPYNNKGSWGMLEIRHRKMDAVAARFGAGRSASVDSAASWMVVIGAGITS